MTFAEAVHAHHRYVATEVINQLLAKGYNVRGTVRSVAATDKVAHLQKLGEALPGTCPPGCTNTRHSLHQPASSLPHGNTVMAWEASIMVRTTSGFTCLTACCSPAQAT